MEQVVEARESHREAVLHGLDPQAYSQVGFAQLLATAAPGSVVRYAHGDHLGSPRLFTDATGVAKERFHYYPFGEQAGTAPAAPEALRFTGHERDSGASSGTTDDLDYMHARYYHPQLGRFLSVDPARASAKPEQPLTWNRYTYTHNNPVNSIDPDGRLPVILGAIVGAVEGAGFQVAINVISGEPLTQGVVQEALIGGGLGATGVGLANTARKGVQAIHTAKVVKAVRSGKASALAERLGLTKSAQKGVRSLEKRIAEHRAKLEAFKKNPEAFDNLDFQKNAPSQEIRQRIVDRRIQNLEGEIEKFEGEIQKILLESGS